MTGANGLRDRACVVGIGRSAYAKRGGLAHEGTLRLALRAIVDACADAGINPKDLDGFSSYSDDAAAPSALSMALGTRRVRYAGMVWGGGGAGMGGAFANAAMAVATGMAETVVVVRSISQGEQRFGQSLAGRGPCRPRARTRAAAHSGVARSRAARH